MVEADTAAQNADTAAAFDINTHTFKTPDKTLVTVEHVEEFKNSSGCQELVGFITALSNACKSTKMTATPLTEVSKSCQHEHVHDQNFPCVESDSTLQLAWTDLYVDRRGSSHWAANEIW